MKKVNFGQATLAAQTGKRIAREGWNGKGMFVFLIPGDTLSHDQAESSSRFPESVRDFFATQKPKQDFVKCNPFFCMYAADKSIVPGWLASQTDMLAEDWVVLD